MKKHSVVNFMLTVLSILVIFTVGCNHNSSALSQSQLDNQLSLMGHRNWVVVVDSAYPLQSRAGIKTVLSDKGQLETVEQVIKMIDQADHVRAKVYLDKEIDFVPVNYAKGIDEYRSALKEFLQHADVQKIPHEQLIAKLDEAAKTYNVLILKTDMTLPYTSVFFELDCGYWSDKAEQDMRRLMRK
jgi:D-ribose pyranose/furanose isomerase RbsD